MEKVEEEGPSLSIEELKEKGWQEKLISSEGSTALVRGEARLTIGDSWVFSKPVSVGSDEYRVEILGSLERTDSISFGWKEGNFQERKLTIKFDPDGNIARTALEAKGFDPKVLPPEYAAEERNRIQPVVEQLGIEDVTQGKTVLSRAVEHETFAIPRPKV